MTSHSITLLKQKFDEIKRNINTIELKQREFFAHGVESKPVAVERPYRPASVSRFSETKPRDRDYNDEILRKLHELEVEKHALTRKLEEKSKENESLRAYAKIQDSKVKTLQQENEQLKNKLENSSMTERRPQSCMRDTRSPSKKNRVAFSKDLISVYPIDENVPIVKASPQIGGYEKLSFVGSYNRSNPFQRNGFSDKYLNEDAYKYRRMGLD